MASDGEQVHIIGIPAGVWETTKGLGRSSMVAGGLGCCSEPGHVAAPHGAGRAGRPKADLGQAAVTMAASGVVSRSLVHGTSLEYPVHGGHRPW